MAVLDVGELELLEFDEDVNDEAEELDDAELEEVDDELFELLDPLELFVPFEPDEEVDVFVVSGVTPTADIGWSLIIAFHSWVCALVHTTRPGAEGALATGTVCVNIFEVLKERKLLASPTRMEVCAKPSLILREDKAVLANW